MKDDTGSSTAPVAGRRSAASRDSVHRRAALSTCVKDRYTHHMALTIEITPELKSQVREQAEQQGLGADDMQQLGIKAPPYA
ncbi:MAG TPA: hypothetical protein VNN62_04780 [Methylomirabilota bacterium]|nr:hypothetical protein [Methylomirabilota bacterium]